MLLSSPLKRSAFLAMALVCTLSLLNACSSDESSGAALGDQPGNNGQGQDPDPSPDQNPDFNEPNNDPNNAPNNDPGFDPDPSPEPDPGPNPDPDMSPDPEPEGNTNVNLGGAQDFGFFRRQLDDNIVPDPDEMDPAGFFAEHHTPLPQPDCGNTICVQAMMGVMGNLNNRNNCTMLQIGLNSTITVDPDDRPPLTLAVVVDISGSMAADGKLDFVRSGLEQMVNELNDDDQIAIITYETRVRVEYEMGSVRGNRNALMSIIRGLRPEGSTNIYDGLQRGYEQVFSNYDSGRQNRVILLSDGEPTAGITDPERIIEMSRAFNSDGIGITTVGMGTDFNINLMRTLSEQADGNFYFVENASAVEEVFTQELSYFTVPVGFDLVLDMYTGEDFSFGRALGSRLFERTETGGHLEVPSIFLAHRTSHDDIEPGGGRRGGGSALLIELMPREDDGTNPEEGHVATVTMEYREPGTNEIITDRVDVTVPFSPWNTPLRGFFENDIVTKSFVMLNIYVALEEACRLFHADEPIEAIVILDRLIAAAADYEDSANGGEGDEDIRLDIELMEQLISVILDNGGSEPEDSGIDEDPWPAD